MSNINFDGSIERNKSSLSQISFSWQCSKLNMVWCNKFTLICFKKPKTTGHPQPSMSHWVKRDSLKKKRSKQCGTSMSEVIKAVGNPVCCNDFVPHSQCFNRFSCYFHHKWPSEYVWLTVWVVASSCITAISHFTIVCYCCCHCRPHLPSLPLCAN